MSRSSSDSARMTQLGALVTGRRYLLLTVAATGIAAAGAAQRLRESKLPPASLAQTAPLFLAELMSSRISAVVQFICPILEVVITPYLVPCFSSDRAALLPGSHVPCLPAAGKGGAGRVASAGAAADQGDAHPVRAAALPAAGQHHGARCPRPAPAWRCSWCGWPRWLCFVRCWRSHRPGSSTC